MTDLEFHDNRIVVGGRKFPISRPVLDHQREFLARFPSRKAVERGARLPKTSLVFGVPGAYIAVEPKQHEGKLLLVPERVYPRKGDPNPLYANCMSAAEEAAEEILPAFRELARLRGWDVVEIS